MTIDPLPSRPSRPNQSLAHAGLAAIAAALLVLGAACPGSPGGKGRPRTPAPELLAADAEAISSEATRAGIPKIPGLVEAYLLHHQGSPDSTKASLCRWLGESGLGAQAAAARISALNVPCKDRLRGFMAALISLGPCDSTATDRQAPRPPATFQAGHYEGALTLQAEGHRVTLRESWLLWQGPEEISGWVIRSETRESTDGRRFVCSKDSSARTHAAWFVTGRLEEGRLALRSKSAFVDTGPCAQDSIAPLGCTGQLAPGGLRMSCPQEILLRHKGPPPGPEHRQVLAWHGVTPRAEGGRDEVSETWHLAGAGDQLRGFYLRETQARALPGRTFQCNQSASFTTQRLFLVTGSRAGEGVTLMEVGALRAPHACDKGAISLDRYVGKREGDSLSLRYGEGAGAGTQTLVLVKGAPSLAPALPWPELK
ncbi:MAG: hypothetical protein RBU30_15670 [Polyangia bacterium]|mgnify:CR=1 FL=1|jgi:hypothetical protein|nr:hypothetical protein [Polyangia bacterium]